MAIAIEIGSRMIVMVLSPKRIVAPVPVKMPAGKKTAAINGKATTKNRMTVAAKATHLICCRPSVLARRYLTTRPAMAVRTAGRARADPVGGPELLACSLPARLDGAFAARDTNPLIAIKTLAPIAAGRQRGEGRCPSGKKNTMLTKASRKIASPRPPASQPAWVAPGSGPTRTAVQLYSVMID